MDIVTFLTKMITVTSNISSSQRLNKTGSLFPVVYSSSLIQNSLGQVSFLYTASDSHIHQAGTSSVVLNTVEFSMSTGSFYLIDGGTKILNSGSIASTSASNATVTIVSNLGTFVYQFPQQPLVQYFDYIYCNTSSLKIRVTNNTQPFWIASASLGNAFNPWYRNTNQMFLNGVDLRGLGFTYGQSYRYVSMITPQHGITCQHSPPGLGETVYFYDSASNIIQTRTILSKSHYSNTDVCLVQLNTTISAPIQPLWVFPPSWPSYIADVNNTYNEPIFPCIIPNSNKSSFEVRAWTLFTGSAFGYPEIQTNGLVSGCPFTSVQLYTGGESSSPCMALLNINGKIQAVFMYAMHYASVEGPFISQPPVFNWLTASVSPYTMSVVDMSSYQSVF